MKRLATIGLVAAACALTVPTATQAETEMVFSGRTTTQWIATLSSESLEERVSATWALGEIGHHAVKAVPALLNAIGDRYPAVRNNAIEALGKIGPGAVAAVPRLQELMVSPEPAVRWRAAQALGRMGPEVAGGAIPLLTAGLTDTDREMRMWSAISLGKMGPAAAGSISALIAALGDPDPAVRYSVADALGLIGSATPEVIAALRTAAGDPVDTVRRGANDALVALGQEPVPPPANPTTPTTPATPATPTTPTTPTTPAMPPAGAIYEWPGSAQVLSVDERGIWYPEDDVRRFTERYRAPYAEALELIEQIEAALAGQGRQLPEALVNLRAVLGDSDYLMVNIIGMEPPVNGVAQPVLEAYVAEAGSEEPLRSAVVGLPGGRVLQGIPILFSHLVYTQTQARPTDPLWPDADAVLRGPAPPEGLPDPYLSEDSGHKITAQRPIVGLAPFVVEAVKTDNTQPRRAALNCSGRVALRHILDTNNITPELLNMTPTAFHSRISNLERTLAAVTIAIGCNVGPTE